LVDSLLIPDRGEMITNDNKHPVSCVNTPLKAQAHAHRSSVAHEVLVALDCRELDEGLQPVR
jgi:hypothetical protein